MSRRYSVAAVGGASGLAAMIGERFRIPTVTFVSAAKSGRTKKAVKLALRIRHHRALIHGLLTRLHMTDVDLDQITPTTVKPGVVRVALFDGDGANGPGPNALEKIYAGIPNTLFRRVSPVEVQSGVLSQFDVLIEPGGSMSEQSASLGVKGRAAVRSFIRGGHGYVGICAGSYIASENFGRSLGIATAKVVDPRHTYRGRANLLMDLTPRGQEIFGSVPGPITVLYHNGPVLTPTGSGADDEHGFEPLAVFRTEAVAKGGKRGLMVGAPAIALSAYGQGRIITISPHPEQTPGLESLVPAAARWVATHPLGGAASSAADPATTAVAR